MAVRKGPTMKAEQKENSVAEQKRENRPTSTDQIKKFISFASEQKSKDFLLKYMVNYFKLN
jgi:hypothetical protein